MTVIREDRKPLQGHDVSKNDDVEVVLVVTNGLHRLVIAYSEVRNNGLELSIGTYVVRRGRHNMAEKDKGTNVVEQTQQVIARHAKIV